MSFPLDLGMVPRTLAEDGDPLDVLVIGDELAAAGCVITVRLLGTIKAEQTEKGHTYRNDQLLARKALSISYAHANQIDDLGPAFVDHLGRWFEQFNALKCKGFRVIGIGGPDAAVERSSNILEQPPRRVRTA
jgi:inorganic pyrophosphatase